MPFLNQQKQNDKRNDFMINLQDSYVAELGFKLVIPGSGPEVIKLFSCSTQLSVKFVLLKNLKLLTIANAFLLYIAQHEIFSANKYENANYCWHFHIY